MLDFELIDRVAVLTLNRPERRNALDSALVAELEKRLAFLDASQQASAIVLAGAELNFCSGSDLKELGTMDVAGMVAHEAHTARMARSIGLLRLPVIAAVEGYALGGGFILATSCDVVVSSAAAKWSLPEVPNGWLPPWGLTALTMRTGPIVARRLVWGYDVLDGAEALRLGVADYCVPEGAALARGLEIAQKIALLPAVAVEATKRFFREQTTGNAEVLDSEAGRQFAACCADGAATATLQRFAARAK